MGNGKHECRQTVSRYMADECRVPMVNADSHQVVYQAELLSGMG